MVNLGNFVKMDFTSLLKKGSTVKGKNLLPSVKEKNLLSVGANSFLHSRPFQKGIVVQESKNKVAKGVSLYQVYLVPVEAAT